MGLDAFVSCNCWIEGRTAPPPVPIRFDHGQGYWDVVDPSDIEAFWDWSRSACEHEKMELVAERIGNWATVRWLERVLIAAGRSRFPILVSSIARVSNDGAVPVEFCAGALLELDELAESSMPAVQLVDTGTGDVLQTVLEPDTWYSRGSLRWHDVDGVIEGTEAPVRIRRRDELLFEAYEFSQDSIGANYRLVRRDDRCSGPGELVVPRPFRQLPDGEVPHRIAVQRRDVRVGEHVFPIADLRGMFAAAVEVGNPVGWA